MIASIRKQLFVIIFLTTFTSILSQAQIVGSNAFLQGTYVEVGINTCGAYGSNALPPAGYHPTSPMTGLGFVADSDGDGMEVGSPPRCGDYFVPGSPVEGWAIQIGASTWVNTDQGCSPFAVPGSITDYSYVGGVYTGVWEGDVPGENLHMTQYTILPEDKIYFVTRVLLCNNGVTPLTDIYYMRNVDPDNDEPWSGDFTTSNIIVENPPTDPEALVTSEGLTYGCFLGIGAKDPNARVTYGNFSTTDGTPYDVWHGLAGYSLTGSHTEDEANSISIYVDTILPGECKCVAFAYILNPDDLDEALDATASVSINANDVSVPSSGDIYVCKGDTIHFQVLGADDYAWSWSTTGGELSIDTGTLVDAYTLSDIDITAVGVGGFCGDATRLIHVHVDSTATSNAGPDQAICIGDAIPMAGSGGVTYQWTPTTALTDPLIATPTANPTTTTTYNLLTYDIHGCPATDAVTITVNPLPNVVASDDASFCIDGTLQLNATGATTYSWSPADGLSCTDCPDPTTTVDVATTYIVTGTDGNGCINTDDVTVSVDFLPVVDAGPDVTINIVLDESTVLNGSGGVSYSWYPSAGLSCTDCQSPTAAPADTTTYYVIVTDANGCQNIDSVTVNVIGYFDVNLPTAFSPNGDGENDYYHPYITGYGALQEWDVYNRWGQLVFSTIDPFSKGWDGKVNGTEADMGVYVIVVTGKVFDEVKLYKGDFTLIR